MFSCSNVIIFRRCFNAFYITVKMSIEKGRIVRVPWTWKTSKDGFHNNSLIIQEESFSKVKVIQACSHKYHKFHF